MIEDIRRFEEIKERLQNTDDKSEKKKILKELNNFDFHDETIADNFFYTLDYKNGKVEESTNKGYLLFTAVPLLMFIVLSMLPSIFGLNQTVHIASLIIMMVAFIVFILSLAFEMGSDGMRFIHKTYYNSNNMTEEELEALDRNLRKEVGNLEDEVRKELIDEVIHEQT